MQTNPFLRRPQRESCGPATCPVNYPVEMAGCMNGQMTGRMAGYMTGPTGSRNGLPNYTAKLDS
eukprot:15455973-Alexandrium_andersonii.AAC.1